MNQRSLPRPLVVLTAVLGAAWLLAAVLGR